MELKELTDKTPELFGVTSPDLQGSALLAACSDPDKLRTFRRLAGGDLSVDWMQKIYHGRRRSRITCLPLLLSSCFDSGQKLV